MMYGNRSSKVFNLCSGIFLYYVKQNGGCMKSKSGFQFDGDNYETIGTTHLKCGFSEYTIHIPTNCVLNNVS
jgi:hypothetical protein